MNASVERLFDEFAASWARGEHPDVRDYLERAGDGRDELAGLLDGFLAASSVQPPSEETLATFAELVPGDHETPPMLAVRVRMGLRRADVVRQLCAGLGLGSSTEEKVARYYHELETGLLDPRGVSSRVWHQLATVLGTGIRSLMVTPYEAPPAVVTAFYRRSDTAASTELDAAPRRRFMAVPDLAAASESAAAPERPDLDEVDRLFRGNEPA